LTLKEAARLLRIGSDELERLARRNEVPARRIGTLWRFDRAALLAAEAAKAHAFEAEDLEKLKAQNSSADP
jgi:excisionase family DNA binding protein